MAIEVGPVPEPQEAISFDWGVSRTWGPELRRHELVSRLRWFIHMRWIAVAAAAVLTAAAALRVLPVELDSGLCLTATAALAATNVVYHLLGNLLAGRGGPVGPIQHSVFAQALTDFAVLSVFTYALGTIETPTVILFVPHINILTRFFPRRRGLVLTFAAAFFAGLPMVLEQQGVLAPVSIYANSFKAQVVTSPGFTAGYIAFATAAYLICWYLVATISASLKLRELQLEEAYDKLTLIDREKTQATLRATHELKAPFAAIKSYVFTLRDGYCGELPEQAQRVVERIGDRCDLLVQKISDIIHLSNLRTLVLKDIYFADVDLVACLRAEVAEANVLGEERGVRVVRQAEELPPVHVRASQEHLSTLVSNLLRNAVTYSDPGGAVEVSVRAWPGRATFRVRDHGIGIPEEHLARIFDEHFRSKNAVRHDPNGNGMGLAIVKEIVRLHGATIEVASTVGEGTHFTVAFDRASEHATDHASAKGSEGAHDGSGSTGR